MRVLPYCSMPPRRGLLASLLWITIAAHLGATPVQRSGENRQPATAAQTAMSSLASLPLRFEANVGQAPAPVRFLARGANYEFLISPTEAQILLRQSAAQEEALLGSPLDLTTATAAPARSASHSVRMRFVGANPNALVRGIDELSGKINYLVGKNSDQWHTGVRSWGQTQIEGIYPGIGLVFYGNQRQLEYDLTLNPGADASLIAIRFEGVDSLQLDKTGALVLKMGEDELQQPCPVLYQMVNGKRVVREGSYRRIDDRTIGFKVGAYDSNLPLVIDPFVSLVYSSYFGGSRADVATAVKVDASGAVYVAGGTLGSFGIAQSVPGFQDRFQGGTLNGDVFVAKFDKTLTNLLFFTYLGGSSNENALDMAIDNANNVYLTGYTDSPDFPVKRAVRGFISGTPHPESHVFPTDGFVAELDSSGSSLVYSTFLGGSSSDIAVGIAVDAEGGAFVTGYTYSRDFPTTVTAFQPLAPFIRGGSGGFIARISPGGGTGSLAYSSYLGGFISQQCQGIAVDRNQANGLAFLTGATTSTNFPICSPRSGVVQSGLNRSPIAPIVFDNQQPPSDAFVAAFDTTRTGSRSLVYSTLLGGSYNDSGYRIAVDSQTNIYVTGFTSSKNFPGPQANAGLQEVHSAATNSDAFLAKLNFNSSPSKLLYSVVFGGNGSDAGWNVALDPSGETVYVVGVTHSWDFPTTNSSGLLRPGITGGTDAFVAAFSQVDTNVLALYSVCLGGTLNDMGYGVAADGEGNAFIVGRTASPDFPTQQPRQPVIRSANDAFVAKMTQSTQDLAAVSIQTDPENLIVDVDGIAKQAPVTEYWVPGSIHTVAASWPVSGAVTGQGTNVQFAWTSWSDGGSLIHEVVAAPGFSLTAFFKTQFFLTTGVTNTTDQVATGGAVIPTSGWFDAGAVVPIVALPPSSNAFTGWLGSGSGSTSSGENPSTVTMNGPIAEIASFSGPLDNVLTIITNGNGSVSPDFGGKSLRVGRVYTLTARPDPTNLFVGWTGSINARSSNLRFRMENGLVLQANFITNPFVSAKGSYAGLFAQSHEVAFPSSGLFTAVVGGKGGISARLRLAGKTNSFSGVFGPDGSFSTYILRSDRLPLWVFLQLDLVSGERMTGQITDGTFLAELQADRAVFSANSPAPQGGNKYTFIIPGAPDSLARPGGNGFGTVTVSTTGVVRVVGTLGDRTKFTQSTFVSRQGQWPLFARLYSKKGAILGPMTFADLSDTDLSGPISWFKPAQSSSRFYQSGFQFGTELAGSLFVSTNSPLLALTNGMLVLQGGKLAETVANAFVLSAANKASGTNRLTLSISTASGTFGGSLRDPATGASISIRGAILQKQNRGAGLFLSSNQTGSVILEPSEE
jgi:hypothetical protein